MPRVARRSTCVCRLLYFDRPVVSYCVMLPKPRYGRSAFAFTPGLAWMVPGCRSWLMLRARSRFDADRPTYDTVPRICHGSWRSTVAFQAHEVGLVKSGDCIAPTSGKLRVDAPPGESTTPLMTVCISDSGALKPYEALVLIRTRLRQRPTAARSGVTTLIAYASPRRGWKPFFGVSEKPLGTP